MTARETRLWSLDETLRRRFEAAWVAGEPEPIDQLLPAVDDANYVATLEELVHIDLEFAWKACAKALRDATSPEDRQSVPRPAAVETYVERFAVLRQREILLRLLKQEFFVRSLYDTRPAIEEYRCRFPDLEISGHALNSELLLPTGIGETALQSASRRKPAGEVSLGAFGNYELLDEIGKGGMGVVYRARQHNVDRVVGLKVIRRELLQSRVGDTQSGALERFHHEVQAAARLEHENIARVYEVGDVDGEPFFSMQYVDGSSLGEMLRDGPIDNRRAAAYLRQVAQAVAAAHREGILHRDLKPQNILIDAKTDRPLVVDFGLAKLQECGDDLTRSGDVMGSPPYMSPEQAMDSSRVTEQSDVYALGATLYHILTGRPPFHAATNLETLRQVVDDQPVPPRRLNPLIDRDLDTICLKCLEKLPSRRYSSAEELADEFRRYLDHEPIRARPIGPFGRTWRWCRRYPLTAASMTLAVTFLIVALVATTVGYIKTAASLTVAERAKAQSDESFRQARNVVDRFFTQVSETDLLDQPGLQPLRRQLLEEAITYYERFLKQRGDDPTIRDELGAAHFRVGRIRELMGDAQAARTAYEQAHTFQRQLVAERPDDRARLTALGETANGIGRILHRLGRFEDALTAYKEAVTVRKRLVTLVPHAAEYQRTLANTYMNVGQTEQLFDLEHARQHFEKAQAIRTDLVASDPQDSEVQRDLAMGHYNLAIVDICAADKAAAENHSESAEAAAGSAEQHLNSAIGIFVSLLKVAPQRLGNKHRLATCYRVLADLKGNFGQMDEALALYEKSRKQILELATANPDVPEYRATLAGLYMNLGLLHHERNQMGDAKAALAALTEAKTLLEPLAQQPATPRYRRDLAVTLRERGRLLSDKTACHESVQAAEKILNQLADSWPDNDDFRRELQETRKTLRDLNAAADGGD